MCLLHGKLVDSTIASSINPRKPYSSGIVAEETVIWWNLISGKLIPRRRKRVLRKP